MDHILSIVLFTPLAGLLVLLFIPSSNVRAIKLWANFAALAGFLVSLPLVFRFDPGKDFQFVERAPWIPTLGATYHIGIDGLGLLLVMLTTVIGFLAVLSSWSSVHDRLKEYYAFFLLLQTGMLGVFMALDFLLFFVFWETVLVPMYFIIGIWGGPRRAYAAIKFMIYTLIGSVLMLLGILTLYFHHFQEFQVYSFDIADLMRLHLSSNVQWWVFWAFFVGFAVKVPMWPFHTWLPDAHVEAPTAGSVILASVLLKMGTYGFLRFSLPLLPDAAKNPTVINIVAVLSIIGIVYGALASLMQKDWKKLVAYSSVSHLGFCTLGIIALNPAGISGSIIQQINHGISTGMLFLIVGVVYERRHTREIAEYGGLLRVMPIFTLVFRRGGAELDGDAAAQRLHRGNHDSGGSVPDVQGVGLLGGRGNRARRGVPVVALPAHHAGRGEREEPDAEGPFLAGDRGVRAADRVGFLDRPEPAAIFPGARSLGGADRGTRAAGILCAAAPDESAGAAEPDRGAAPALNRLHDPDLPRVDSSRRTHMMRCRAALVLAILAAAPAFAENVYKVEFNIRDGNESAKAGRRYTMLINNGTKGVFKLGSRVPVVTGSFQPGGNTQFTYIDVGVNIECSIAEHGPSVGLNASIDLSMIAPPEKGVPPAPNPTITQIRFNLNADLPPGKSTAVTTVDDPVTTRKFEVEATVTKVN